MSTATARCLLGAAALLTACRGDPSGPPAATAVESNALAVAPAPQRAKWRFKLDGDYALNSPGVGPDGTIYVALTSGKLYAIAPDGTLRWIFLGAQAGPVSVGADGTIYVAGAVAAPGGTGSNGAIFAIAPNGTEKWRFTQTNQLIMAGPSVGPDGNIYAVTMAGIGLFSLTPAGQLRFSTGYFVDNGYLGEEIAFGPGQLYFSFDMAGTGTPPTLFGYGLDGTPRFQAPRAGDNSRADVGPNGNVVIESFPIGVGLSLASYSPAGSLLWSFYQWPGNTEEHPHVGPDNVSYTVRNLATLFAIGPSGLERWHYVDANILFEPKVRPQNDLLFMGGRITYGQPGFFQAVSTAGAPLWRVDLPDEPGFSPYGQLVPMTRPVFSPDGNTGYGVTDVAGDGASAKPYSFLYAIDLSPAPMGNRAPVASLVATTATTIRVGGKVTVRANFTDPDNGPWRDTFRWGNGPTSGTASAPGPITATHSYPKAGTYRISFIVADALGAADTSNVVTVRVQ
jgi:PKD domain-containing protein/putative pyrroloquinoline-quinone-binding quinoprotein